MTDFKNKGNNERVDQVVVSDLSSRRTFIRTGTAFLVAGAALAARKPVYADDCDRGVPQGSVKNTEQANSDSDSGEGADAEGCARKGKPAITRLSPDRRGLAPDSGANAPFLAPKVEKIEA